jgi:hypothetical protein
MEAKKSFPGISRSRWCTWVAYANDLCCFNARGALTYFLGGEEKVVQTLPLSRNAVPLGGQRFHLAGPEIAFRLTALTDAAGAYEAQLRSLLHHSPLRLVQWINMAHHRIEFVTLTK